jgi:hypothetical protein
MFVAPPCLKRRGERNLRGGVDFFFSAKTEKILKSTSTGMGASKRNLTAGEDGIVPIMK